MRALLPYLYRPRFWQVVTVCGNFPEKQIHWETRFLPESDLPSFSRRALHAGETGFWLVWSCVYFMSLDSSGMKGFTDSQ